VTDETELVEIHMTNKELATVALAAHIRNMTLNDYICKVMRDYFDKYPEYTIGIDDHLESNENK